MRTVPVKLFLFLTTAYFGLTLVTISDPSLLFSDDFSTATAGSIATPSSSAWSTSTCYTVFTCIYPAGECVKLGKADEGGVLTTTNMALQAGTLYVQVDALGWASDEKSFCVSDGSESHELTCLYDKSTTTQFQTFTQEIAVAAGVRSISFSTENGQRIFLDNILITHTLSEDQSPLDFFVYHHSPTSLVALSELSFTITASISGTPTNILYASGLPENANYTFNDNLFTWTPSLTQTGTYTLVFTALDASGTTHEKQLGVTVLPLLLAAPANLTVSNLTYRAFQISWEPVPAATEGYGVDVIQGSTTTNTPETDVETFFEIDQSGLVIAPTGWFFSGVTETYATPEFVELKLNDAEDRVITKWYPKPVSQLNFRLRGYATHADSNNVLAVHGSTNGVVWQKIGHYTTQLDEDGDDENNIFTRTNQDLDKSLLLTDENDYHQFSFVYENKEYGNIGLAQISALYPGSGSHFVKNWQAVKTEAQTLAISGVPSACELIVRVSAQNETDLCTSQIRLITPDCQRETILMLQ